MHCRSSQRYNQPTLSAHSSSRWRRPDFSHCNDFVGSTQLRQCTNVLDRYRPTYPDVPSLSRISEKKRSIFLASDQRKYDQLFCVWSAETSFKETPTDLLQTKLLANKEAMRATRHIGLQTDYREESTQTDPFSPAYTISGAEHPEVFALSDFTYGKGLPATALEISFIERLRARREWEQDRTFDITRARIVIEREIREWQMRDTEIRMIHDTRQKLFTKHLQTYIQSDEELTQSILDLFIYREEKQLETKHRRLQIECSREIRRIERLYHLRDIHINAVTRYNHLGVIGLVKRGQGCYAALRPPWRTRTDDTLTAFKTSTSTNYIPCVDFDRAVDRLFHQAGVDVFKFEERLPKSALMPTIAPPDLLNTRQKKGDKKRQRRWRDLEKAVHLIEQEKTKQSATVQQKPLRFVERIETVDRLEQSQTAPIRTAGLDPRRVALIQFQSYLRGITVRSKISNVRRMREHLLEELRTDPGDNQAPPIATSHDVATQICDYLEGTTIADMLDFLAKELLRLQCEQAVHLFILLADRHRHEREEKETALRVKSLERQQLQERALQEMFSLHSNAEIDTYLQDLILHSISHTADEQARRQIEQITNALVDHSASTESELELLASRLVHQFLLPTVQRILSSHHSSPTNQSS